MSYLYTSDGVHYDDEKKQVTVNTAGCGCCSDTERHNIKYYSVSAIEEYVKDIQAMLDTANAILKARKEVDNG